MILNLVVPCYNEALVLPETTVRLVALLDRLSADGVVSRESGIYFIDDGSGDQTWALICGSRAARPDRVHGIRLARNCGHQAALLAGLRTVPGDALISIDADLQDDIDVIPSMIEEFTLGHDIVYGVRAGRKSDTTFKRQSAWLYYRILGMMGVDIVLDHADFRLMSRRALDAFLSLPEQARFIRGIVAWVGFRQVPFPYDRAERFAGETNYPLSKMLRLAFDAMTGFSTKPLTFASHVGLALTGASFLLLLYIAVGFFSGSAVPGWTSLAFIVVLLGAVQMFVLGMIGEYLGRLYVESKRRPLYLVSDVAGPVQGKATLGYRAEDRFLPARGEGDQTA